MTTFRAAQVTSPRGRLALVDRTLTDPAPGTVRVAVEACGICHTDSVLVDDMLPGLQFRSRRVTRSPGASTRWARVWRVGARVNGWPASAFVVVGVVGYFGNYDLTSSRPRAVFLRQDEPASRAHPRTLGRWRAFSKSSRSDLARRPKRGTNMAMIRWNLSTSCSTVMPNTG
jgi:NADPH:quinone reductase-like Zn-dependent oxidoreductase